MKQQIAGKTVRVLGRTAEDGGMLWLMSSLSEAGFTVNGAAEVKLVLKADDTVSDPARLDLRPRYAVHVDGKRILDARQNETEKEVTVFRGEGTGSHTVRLVKLSECSQSLVGVKEILTDGKITPLPEKGLKIEFIGDSITCGYGVEGTAADTFSTATENAEKSHAFLAAKALGADAYLTAYSGCGLISGYTENEINEGNLMIPVYEKAGRIEWTLPGGRKPQEIPWDFSVFTPDYVVIHLGNNDLSWTRGIPEREELFLQRYLEFLAMVRKNNPKARILCVLGIDGDDLVDRVAEAVEYRRERLGDRAVRFLRLPQADEARYGAGADHHPSEEFQRVLSEVLEKALRDWIKSLFP